MSLEAHKAVVHAFTEAINSHDLDRLDAVIADEYIQHRPDLPDGREAVKRYFAELLHAFPDLAKTTEDIVAEGDKVWVRATNRGTHLGPFRGIPPTGRRIEYRVVDIFRVANGQLVEHWDVVDQTAMLLAIGALQERPGTP